jgi:hypothetical protein
MRQAHTAALLSLALGAGVSLAAAPPPRLAPPSWHLPSADAVQEHPLVTQVVAPERPYFPAPDDALPIPVAPLEMLPAPRVAEDVATPTAAPATGCCKQCEAPLIRVASLEMLPAPKVAEDVAPPAPVAPPATGCCCKQCEAPPAAGCSCKQCDAQPAHCCDPAPLPEHEGEHGRTPIRLWGGADFLLWWFKNSPEPVSLAATRPLNLGGTPTFGTRDLDTGEHSGGRFTLGAWFCEDQAFGVEGSYFFFGSKGVTQSHIPAREFFPFVSTAVGPTGIPFADPTLDTARETLSLSQFLQGFSVNGVANVLANEHFRVDVLGGFRYLDLTEDLDFRVDLRGVPGGFAPGFVGTYADHFGTRNQFFGGNVGARVEGYWRGFFVNATAQVALGDSHERLSIAGNSAQSGGGPSFFNGPFPGQGVFAQQTNGGITVRDRFAVLPEGSVNVGYEVNSHVRAMVGYSFLYLSDVVRPGAQLSSTVNTSNVPFFGNLPGPLVGPAQPLPTGRSSDFWGQGFSVGVELRY